MTCAMGCALRQLALMSGMVERSVVMDWMWTKSMAREVSFAIATFHHCSGREKPANNQKGDNRRVCVDRKKGMRVSEGGVDGSFMSRMICGETSQIARFVGWSNKLHHLGDLQTSQIAWFVTLSCKSCDL